MNDLKKLSDAELDAAIERAMHIYDSLQEERRVRERERLAAAYGDELPFVSDLWAGTVERNGKYEIRWCFYCGVRPGWQREHKIPRSRGGIDHPSNIVMACMACNLSKGRMTVEEYRASLERRAGRPHVFFGERASR
jgi:5-methylcytosine-specific restriction endonuclease McrA